MWCRSYRDHAIMPFPSFDAITRRWLCQANVTWISGPHRESTFLRFPESVDSEAEAVASSLRAAQDWIDAHVEDQLFEPSTMPPSAGLPAVTTPTALARSRPVKSSARALTFEQFKSFMKSWAHRGSEKSLHKSYAALRELRKTRHRSWAEIRPKLRNLGDRAAQSRSIEEKRLPLTTKDWRRII